MNHASKRTFLFLSSIIILTAAATALVASTLVLTEESFVASLLWIAGFGFLSVNVSYLFHLSLICLFIRKPLLQETYVKKFPTVALVYPIRNEGHGLFERVDFSLSGNKLPALDLWILSDSSEDFIPLEKDLVQRLREKYGTWIHYRRRPVPFERKQGNIKEFLDSHPEYLYLYVADADSTLPKGVILKLLRKAEHPENRDVAIFQCQVRIAHARTWYARFERIGTAFSQRLNFTVLQALFGRSISFGHHHLARTQLLRNIMLPKGLLSHDNWDTVLLDQMGYRVVFCPDVQAFDEAPSNYLESRTRARRWAQGTLQGWPLVFKPGVSPASRFLTFYGIYLYMADIVFFFWVLLGLLAHSAPTGELIHFKIDTIFLGLFTNSLLLSMLAFSLGVILFHKVVIVRSLRDLCEYLYELFFSTLVTLNNFFYVPLDILTIPLRKLNWQPMSKNPFEKVRFRDAVMNLWPGTALGLAAFYFCTQETPYFVWQATPVMASLIFSIFTVYSTAKPVPPRLRVLL
jgi:membrane glycosyltransferase